MPHKDSRLQGESGLQTDCSCTAEVLRRVCWSKVKSLLFPGGGMWGGGGGDCVYEYSIVCVGGGGGETVCTNTQ